MADQEHINEHLNRKGRYFDFHDKVTYIEKQEITVQRGGIFNNGPAPDDRPASVVVEGTDIAAQMKGIFCGNIEAAQAYLHEIEGLKPLEVISITKKYIDRRTISQLSCHRDLWKILHDNGYYAPSESNWNMSLNN